MSSPVKKEKRRIVPMHIVENDEKKVTKPITSAYSETTQKHFKTLYHKDVEEELRKRAVKLGYEKERKPRSHKKKKDSHHDHGTHHEHMDSFSSYIKHFATMKSHSKGVSLYDYLRKNYDKHLYFSSTTKRFRKL